MKKWRWGVVVGRAWLCCGVVLSLIRVLNFHRSDIWCPS